MATSVLVSAPEWRGGPTRFPVVIDPVEVMSQGVVAQAAVVSLADPRDVAGFVQLLSWDARTRSAALSVGLSQTAWRRVWPIEGVVAFVAWSFRTFDLELIRLSIGDEVMARHRLRLDRWAILEASGIGASWWRLERAAWFGAEVERLVGLVL